jgi:SAM-dependent methyltransferase
MKNTGARLFTTLRGALRGGTDKSPRPHADAPVGVCLDDTKPRLHDLRRLDQILPVLRCPETGLALSANWPDELVSVDGSRRWPIISGRPNFYPSLGLPIDHGQHLSHPICTEAQAVIDAADGLVLSLSAGGSLRWNPKVVELEAGIFRNTDVLADAHRLPFANGACAAVVALNAFEHYRDPFQVAREIARVLRPGGLVFIHTAFLQPLHESPRHFYNATRFGILEWFSDFDTEELRVSENFNPVHTVAWIAAEAERMLKSSLSPEEAQHLLDTTLREYAKMWTDPSCRKGPVWDAFLRVPADKQEGIAAGFEYIGRRK